MSADAPLIFEGASTAATKPAGFEVPLITDMFVSVARPVTAHRRRQRPVVVEMSAEASGVQISDWRRRHPD
jgi:hypothetical protein